MKEFPFLNPQCPYCGNRMELVGAQTFFVPDDEEQGREDEDFDGTIFVCVVVPKHTMILGLTDFAPKESTHERQDNKDESGLCPIG